MIIQCEKCQARFKLDDSKVTDKGVKVRCAKCKHVFTVRKEEDPAPETFETTTDTGFAADFSSAAESNNPPVTDESPFISESVTTPQVNDITFRDSSPEPVVDDFNAFETSTFDASAISFESNSVNFGDAEEKVEESPAAPETKVGEVDFSGFDFGDAEPAASLTESPAAEIKFDEFTETEEVAAPTPPILQKESPQGLDFSDDDLFGAVVQPTPEATTDNISFDFGEDSFSEAINTGGQDSGAKSGSLFSLDSPVETPFSLGEIDFGDELTSVAVQQVNPDDLKPSQEILFAPIAAAQEKAPIAEDDDITKAFLGEASAPEEQELPPLSITSRRKQSPLFNGLIAVISVLAISVLGYVGYSSFSKPKEAAVTEAGKISVRAVKASYVKNSVAGELLIISGEALNEYPNPRAALQVKVAVTDAAGQSVATKTAYGGNPLTDDQLKILSMEKIETAMGNQFGDSLANMEVPPGKTIPFVVVIGNLPKGAKDFTVQAAGSTVATGKQ